MSLNKNSTNKNQNKKGIKEKIKGALEDKTIRYGLLILVALIVVLILQLNGII